MRFVDTDVLLYPVSQDPDEQGKAKRANEILAAKDLALSVQVPQELYVRATRESRADPLSHEQAAKLVGSRSGSQPGVVLAALATRARFGISYWDAAILEASRTLSCDVVLSEDLSDGQDYDGVRVENPFRDC